jgi:putative transposase
MSERKACNILGLSRTVYHYKSVTAKRDDTVIGELNRLAGLHPGYGFWKMYDRLRMEGFVWNHKRVHRVYTGLRLNIRRRHKRRLPTRVAVPMSIPALPNQMWSMDFMHDSLYDGRKVKIFNVLEDFNRQALLMEADTSVTSRRVIELLDQLIERHGKPIAIRTDNGPEFMSHILTDWCHRRRIQHQFIQPGKPVQNSLVERFNGSYRKEVLDAFVFYSMKELRLITDKWKEEYNSYRPHDALKGLTPICYLLNHYKLKKELNTFNQVAL